MRKKSIIQHCVLFLLVVNFPLVNLFSQEKYSNKNLPVLRYTANSDPTIFKYDLLENTEKTLLYRGSPESGTWNHHTMITYFNGVLYASWDQHARDENASGQHGLIRRSPDMGESWTDVEILFPPLSRKVPAAYPYPYTRFQSNNGFVVMDGILFAITDVGEWSAAGKGKIGPRIKLGRLARTLNPDGSMGDIFWLLDKAPKPVPGFPAFVPGDPVLVDKLNEYLSNPLTEPQLLFGVGDFPGTDDGSGTGEGQARQLEDGTWVKMFRDSGLKGAKSQEDDKAAKSRRNYACYSFDDGQTWTLATRTSFPDACGRSTSGKLPDGQAYIINAGWPVSNKKGGRSIQTLSLSRDGLDFDRTVLLQFIAPAKRYEGRSKAVGFQAHSVVAGKYLFVLSSLNKEDIQLLRIPLSELESFDDMPYLKKPPNPAMSQASSEKNLPVVRWTAYGSDNMTFVYNFLENMETIKIHTAIPETGIYNHEAHIAYHKGIIYARWDNHLKDENGSGQRNLFRRSSDGGTTWTPMEELFPSQDKMLPRDEAHKGTRFQTSNGFAMVDDVLYAVAEVDDHGEGRVNIGKLCRSFNPNGTPGKMFWLDSEAPEPVPGFPAYPAGDAALVGKINNYFQQPGNEIQLNYGPRANLPISDDNHRMWDPTSAWQLSNGTWVKLYRDAGQLGLPSPKTGPKKELEASKHRRNYAVYSFDDGKTWTIPTVTTFPDACAVSNSGKLPDGQVYVINNVLPLSTKHGGRQFLAISFSRDGLNFDRAAVIRFNAPTQRYKGHARSKGYAYPHSVIEGDNLWVIYSVNKEDIQLTRIPLDELYKL